MFEIEFPHIQTLLKKFLNTKNGKCAGKLHEQTRSLKHSTLKCHWIALKSHRIGAKLVITSQCIMILNHWIVPEPGKSVLELAAFVFVQTARVP